MLDLLQENSAQAKQRPRVYEKACRMEASMEGQERSGGLTGERTPSLIVFFQNLIDYLAE